MRTAAGETPFSAAISTGERPSTTVNQNICHFTGICSMVSMVIGLTEGRLSINLDLLGVFIGPGLLRLRRGWRTCALVFLWLDLIILPIAVLLFIFAEARPHYLLFGEAVGDAPRAAGVILMLLLFGLAIWQ